MAASALQQEVAAVSLWKVVKEIIIRTDHFQVHVDTGDFNITDY